MKVIVEILHVGNRNSGIWRAVGYHYLIDGESVTFQSQKGLQELTRQAENEKESWEYIEDIIYVNSIDEMHDIIATKYDYPTFFGKM